MLKKVCACAVLTAIVAAFSLPTASALPPINIGWKAKYVEGNSNAKFVESAKTANCLVCHGEEKKIRNDYGKAVGKYLTKAKITDLKNGGDNDALKKYIEEGLGKAEAEKSKGGKTYGELIKAGHLPSE